MSNVKTKVLKIEMNIVRKRGEKYFSKYWLVLEVVSLLELSIQFNRSLNAISNKIHEMSQTSKPLGNCHQVKELYI